MKTPRHLLRVLRAAHEPKLSQRQVAVKLRMHRLRYWQIENGEVVPTAIERLAIAEILGVRVTDIAWPEIVERERAS